VAMNRCRDADDPVGRAESGSAIVRKLPEPEFDVRDSAGTLHALAARVLGERHLDSDDAIEREPGPKRRPAALGHDEFHGLEPPLAIGS
jgi:hypothetical protein